MTKLGWLVFLVVAGAGAQSPKSVPYVWKSVQIVGGGFVDGVIFHPSAKDVRYARTDMGGAYRWDGGSRRWAPILDATSYKDANLMGVESIAVDPEDAQRVYLACGTYTSATTPNGAILRSKDGGASFERTDVPFKFGGNEDGRGNGERLAVDPGDGRVLFLGTRHDGLWRSGDRGASWSRVASFPDVAEVVPPTPPPVAGETPQQRYQRRPVRGDGVVFVLFAPGAKGTATRTMYVGVSLRERVNLFVSKDGGGSWSGIAGEPTRDRPLRAALGGDGFLYVVYGSAPGPTRMVSGSVWKLDTGSGVWTDITPDRPVAGSREFGYAGVSVDAQHPGTVIVSSFNRYGIGGGEDIFRSTDGGGTWREIFHPAGGKAGVYDYSLAPYVKNTGIHWLFDIEIDPLNSDHAVFTTGYGGWESFDLTAADRELPTHWSILASGIEETVGLELDSPTKGAPLLSAIGDYGGFVHADLDRPAPEGASSPPRLGNTTGIASATLRPEVVVRVGNSAEGKAQSLGYSLDGGKSWRATGAPAADSRSGSIAVSADGGTWVWTPERAAPFVTRDQGASWAAVPGLPVGTRVVADPVDPRSFYALTLSEMQLWRSTDGAASFRAESFKFPEGGAAAGASHGDPRGGQDRLYAAPGHKGDLWLPAFDGLYRFGQEGLRRLPGVEAIHAFGFGRAAPGASYPALYLVGTVTGVAGIFRSTDEGTSWVRINDEQHQWGLVLQIAGDPKVYGRVYLGTHGRGILYGDPR